MKVKKMNVGGINFTCASMGEAVRAVTDAAKKAQASQFVFANAYSLVLNQSDKAFCDVCRAADYVFPDGISVVAAARVLHGVTSERLAGPDLLDRLLTPLAEESLSVFLFGSSPRCLEAMVARMRREHPRLHIAGAESPPFGAAWDSAYDDFVLEIIRQSGAVVVLVGVSTPRQDLWIARHKSRLRGAVLGIGAAFDFYAGLRPRAPFWVRMLGLEWLLRLLTEPRRLWRRYLLGNLQFLAIVFKQLLGRK